MGSVLIVTNNYSIDPELIEKMEEEKHTVHLVKDTCAASEIIDKRYFDGFIMITDDPLSEENKEFLDKLQKQHIKGTMIVFISKKRSLSLQDDIRNYIGGHLLAYPVNQEELIELMSWSMELASAIDTKKIILRKRWKLYPYRVKDIFAVERTEKRHIKIHYCDPDKPHIVKTEEFFYRFSLKSFIKKHGLEKHMRLVQNAWLVNLSKVKMVDPTAEWLVLINGMVVPTTKKFIEDVFGEGSE